MSDTTVSISEARMHLSRLVDRVAAGEEIVISRRGKPVARLTQLAADRPPVRFGVLKGRIEVADDFDGPLSRETLAAFLEET